MGHISDKFLLTCLLRGMTQVVTILFLSCDISTHMPLARHDIFSPILHFDKMKISTHMPLARHDAYILLHVHSVLHFYSHASCEA